MLQLSHDRRSAFGGRRSAFWWRGSASGKWAEAPPLRYYRLWSTSGWYISYWNAFLLKTMETLWIGHCNPFSSDPFVFNEKNFASVIAELSQAWCKRALTLSHGDRHVMLLPHGRRSTKGSRLIKCTHITFGIPNLPHFYKKTQKTRKLLFFQVLLYSLDFICNYLVWAEKKIMDFFLFLFLEENTYFWSFSID